MVNLNAHDGALEQPDWHAMQTHVGRCVASEPSSVDEHQHRAAQESSYVPLQRNVETLIAMGISGWLLAEDQSRIVLMPVSSQKSASAG